MIAPAVSAAPSEQGVQASGGTAGGVARPSHGSAPRSGTIEVPPPDSGSHGAITASGAARDKADPAKTSPRHVPQHAVGDLVPESVPLETGFVGVDLPDAAEDEGYVRTDEFIYRLDRKSRRIKEVIPIYKVLLW